MDYRFPDPTSPPSDMNIALPEPGFTFGTCSAAPLQATPTYELGPFDYPLPPSSSRRGSVTVAALPLGLSHRRHSVITRDDDFSPASSRRSSSTSAYRRPSVISLASTDSIIGPGSATVASPTMDPSSKIASVPVAARSPTLHHSHIDRRRSALLFHQKPVQAPIPPSLLARRGSLPTAQLFKFGALSSPELEPRFHGARPTNHNPSAHVPPRRESETTSRSASLDMDRLLPRPSSLTHITSTPSLVSSADSSDDLDSIVTPPTTAGSVGEFTDPWDKAGRVYEESKTNTVIIM